jgi:Tfp pilus assembly protein PilO
MSGSTKTTLIFSVLLFVAAIATFIFMVYQLQNQGTTLNQQREAVAAELAQRDSFIRLTRLSEGTVEEREQLQQLFLISDLDRINFLNLLDSIALERGISLEPYRGDEEDSGDGTGWIIVNITFSGSRDTVENYFKVLETLPYVLQIDDYSLQNTSGSEWSASLTLRVKTLEYDE